MRRHCPLLVRGRPDFTHTKAFFNVPLSLTTTSSLFCGAPVCARSQTGFADMSSVAIFGFSPANATLPVTVPPLASSGVADAPPAAAGAVRLGLGRFRRLIAAAAGQCQRCRPALLPSKSSSLPVDPP